jgi:hypothetical protein
LNHFCGRMEIDMLKRKSVLQAVLALSLATAVCKGGDLPTVDPPEYNPIPAQTPYDNLIDAKTDWLKKKIARLTSFRNAKRRLLTADPDVDKDSVQKDIRDANNEINNANAELRVITGAKNANQAKVLKGNVEAWMKFYHNIQEGARIRNQDDSRSPEQKEADLKRSAEAAKKEAPLSAALEEAKKDNPDLFKD